MSMSDYPCSGFAVLASKLVSLLPTDLQNTCKKHIEEQETEELMEIFSEHLPSNFPPVSDVFTVNAETSSDEWEEGDVIALFDQTDLFVSVKRPEMLAMEQAGVAPKYSMWTQFS